MTRIRRPFLWNDFSFFSDPKIGTVKPQRNHVTLCVEYNRITVEDDVWKNILGIVERYARVIEERHPPGQSFQRAGCPDDPQQSKRRKEQEAYVSIAFAALTGGRWVCLELYDPKRPDITPNLELKSTNRDDGIASVTRETLIGAALNRDFIFTKSAIETPWIVNIDGYLPGQKVKNENYRHHANADRVPPGYKGDVMKWRWDHGYYEPKKRDLLPIVKLPGVHFPEEFLAYYPSDEREYEMPDFLQDGY